MPLFSIDDTFSLTAVELAFARARVRRNRLVAAGMLLVTVAGVFTARPLIHAIKIWQSRRAASEALACIDQGHWDLARERAAAAMVLWPTEPTALRANARLLTRVHSTGALPYYRELRRSGRLSVQDRRDFAEIALFAGATSEAAEQSAWLLAHPETCQGTSKAMPSSADLLFAAQIASGSGDDRQALGFARQVLANPAASEAEQFTAAVRLVNAAAVAGGSDDPTAAPSWERVRRLADSPGPIGLQALILLSRRPVPAPGAPPPGFMSALEIARALEAHPLARVPERLLALDLVAGSGAAAQRRAVDTAVARWQDGDDTSLAALATWLLAKGEAARALDILTAARVAKSVRLCTDRLNALATLGRWTEIKTTLSADTLPLNALSQHMYLASARTHLNETAGATYEWGLALTTAGKNAGQLYPLGLYAESQGACATAETAYQAAINAAPDMRPAYLALCRLADSLDHTDTAEQALTAMLKHWPQDDAASNAEGYHRLLLGATTTEAQAIEKAAAALAPKDPKNWQIRATLSLARLRQGEATAALQAFVGLRAAGNDSIPPGALAVRAAAMAAAGWKEEAAADAHALSGKHLLPEERTLIAPLLVY